jgi:hypothetical protein
MSFTRAVDLATALQAYAVRQKSDKTSDTNRLLQEVKLRKGSFDTLFPTMFSLHGLDIKVAIDKAVSDKDITPNAAAVAVRAINKAMKDIVSRYPVLDTATLNEITAIVDAFVNEFNTGGSDSVSKEKATLMNAHMERLKAKFSQPYIVSYFEGSIDKLPSVKIAHNSFANLRTIVNNRIKESIVEELEKNKITNSKLKDSTFLTTKIINWGHTQADNSIITGKLLAEVLSARNALKNIDSPNEVFKVVVRDFLQQTGQEKTVIKLHKGDLTKGDPNVLQMVITSGIFQTVAVQNRRENQEELGSLEKKWSFTEAVSRNNLLKALGVNSMQALVNMLLKVKSSPSTIDDITTLVVSALKGKKAPSTKKSTTLLNKSTPVKKSRKSVTVVNKKGPALRKDGVGLASSRVNLDSLLLLINRQLQDVVSANMGDGTSKNILNYRTGRFAGSAEVIKLSESRNGMITAFYSYMKNPYATFSEGGRQQNPKSRDPKLLISGSIREIAAQQVANQLRAVSV